MFCQTHKLTLKENAMEDFKPGNDFTNQESYSSAGTGTAAVRMKEQVIDKAAEAKDKLADFGRQTIDKIDESRPSAAGVLDQTATTLHASGEKLSGVAH